MVKLKFILLGCFILIATSCNGLFGVDNNVGKPIQFGASQHPTTRTSYSLEYEGRIDWEKDDQVSIYMDWDDGSGYTGNPEGGIYDVLPGSDFHSDYDYGRKSYGRISYNSGVVLKWKGAFNGGDGHAHEYPHTFYSAYPPTTLVDGGFNFNLPSSQDGITMHNAYMVAYEEGVNSNYNGGHVELQYWPAITTLCVTIYNDLDYSLEGTLELVSRSKKVAGDYHITADRSMLTGIGAGSDRVFRTVDKIPSGDYGEVEMFFIIPWSYDDLYFVFNGDAWPINETIQPTYKYNIQITASKKEIGLSDAVAQMLALSIRHWINDQNAIFTLLQNFYKVDPPEGKNNWFNNNIWGKFCNLTNDEATFKKLTYQDLVDVFGSKEAVEALVEYVRQKSYEKDVNITASPKICTSLIGTDLVSLFPGATNIYLQVSQNYVDGNNPIHVDIEGFLYLKTVTIEYAQSVKLKNCPNLTKATFQNPSSIFNVNNVSVENCPKYNN